MPANALSLNNVAMLASASQAGLRPTLYVDSVNGDDSNDGRSAANALQTLDAVESAMTSGEVIGLAYGSHWRESLDLSALSSVTVMPYGDDSLAAPFISGLETPDVLDWSKTSGRTNVYQATITHDANGTNRLRAFLVLAIAPDYVPEYTQLTGVADVATCDATTNSFVRIVGSDGSPATLYVNVGGSSPALIPDGNVSYTARMTALAAGSNATIYGPIETGFAISNNGSIDTSDKINSVVKQAFMLHGSKHNGVFGAGTVEDSIAGFADVSTAAEPSSIALTFFKDAAAGYVALAKRCGVFGPGMPSNDWYFHGNASAWQSVTAEQCWTVDTGKYVGAFDAITGSYYRDALNIPVENGYWSMVMFDLSNAADSAASSMGYYNDITLTDCVFLTHQKPGSPNNEIFRVNGTHAVTFTRCSLFLETAISGLGTNWFANGNANMDLTVNNTVVFNGLNLLMKASGASYVGDYNVFIGVNAYSGDDTKVYFQVPAGYVDTLAAWQSATGQDANSVRLGRSDQARGNAYAFWLGVANDENDGPIDGDWRINPDARVYGGDGTAYIGTFADGSTPITEAGAQNHWNWNARASASGPPTRFPDVPASITEAREYIASPLDWNFYP